MFISNLSRQREKESAKVKLYPCPVDVAYKVGGFFNLAAVLLVFQGILDAVRAN